MSRRRKSSSRRSKSGKKRGRILVVLGLILGGLLIIGVIVALLGIRSYLRSDGFRNMVSNQTSRALHTEGEYAPFNWTGSSIYSDAFQGEGGLFKKFQADGVRASVDFASWKRAAWEVTDVTINKLSVAIASEKITPDEPIEEESAQASPGGGLLSGMLPSKAKISGVEVNHAYLSYVPGGQAGADSAVDIRGTKLSLKPFEAGEGWSIDAKGGRGKVGKHQIEIDHLNTRFSGGHLFITDTVVDVYQGARLEGSGDVELTGRKSVDLQFVLTDLDVTNVLPKHWLHKITGDVMAKTTLTGNVGQDLMLKGDVIVKEGVLKALPVLDTIVKHTGVESFRTLVLNKARFQFTRRGNRLEISQIFVESNGLLRVEGAFSVVDKQLDGSLNVGVAPGKLRRLPGAESIVFKDQRDGFRWAVVKLGGTIDAPVEDLSSRLKAAVLPGLIEDAGEKAVETIETVKDAATGAVDGTKKATESLIDGAGKALDGVLKMTPLFGQ